MVVETFAKGPPGLMTVGVVPALPTNPGLISFSGVDVPKVTPPLAGSVSAGAVPFAGPAGTAATAGTAVTATTTGVTEAPEA